MSRDLAEPVRGCPEPVLQSCDLAKPVCEVAIPPCKGTVGWVLTFYLSHELICWNVHITVDCLVSLTLNLGLFVGY